MTEETALGTVAVPRRYPVKSMLGEDLPSGEVTARGLAGDRMLGLVHRETGTGGNFVDFAPLHLITTSTLDRIAALSPRGAVEFERYRPSPGRVRLGDVARPA
ncbi:MAG TPA: MOSC N-terminal beta barrel domain-containing protein [Trebonia sp.]|nr:MOSC N-terminal beta barrel domain-containing protein [Trebonia sp.]